MNKKLVVFFCLILLSLSFISAGWFGDFFGKITGQVTEETKITAVNATASRTWNLVGRSYNYNVENVIDGTSAAWGADEFAPQWVEIDLGVLYDITKIKLQVIQSPPGDPTKEYTRTIHEVYMGNSSNPGGTPVHTFSGFTIDGQWLEQTVSVQGARYVMVLTTVSPSWVGWREIEVYGVESGGADVGGEGDVVSVDGDIDIDGGESLGDFCQDLEGDICESYEICDGEILESSDANCCSGECKQQVTTCCDVNLDGKVDVGDVGIIIRETMSIDDPEMKNRTKADANVDGRITGIDVEMCSLISFGFLEASDLPQRQTELCDVNLDRQITPEDSTFISNMVVNKYLGILNFANADGNGDGIVTVEDSSVCLQRYLDRDLDLVAPSTILTTYCDVNADGVVTMSDAIVIDREVQGLENPNMKNIANADSNGDGEITSIDKHICSYTSLSMLFQETLPMQTTLLCDVDTDGLVTSEDNRLIDGIVNENYFGILNFANADGNGDGVITPEDSSFCLQRSLNFEIEFPDGVLMRDIKGDFVEKVSILKKEVGDERFYANVLGGVYYKVEPHVIMNQEAVLKFTYDDRLISQFVNESSLTIVKFYEDMQIIIDSEVDTENNIITANVDRLGDFAIAFDGLFVNYFYEHYYTASEVLKSAAESNGYNLEGTIGYIYSSSKEGTVPLYEVYDDNIGDHYYLTDSVERQSFIDDTGYEENGIVGYIETSQKLGTTPLYRLFPLHIGDTRFTTSVQEKDEAVDNLRGLLVEVYSGIISSGEMETFLSEIINAIDSGEEIESILAKYNIPDGFAYERMQEIDLNQFDNYLYGGEIGYIYNTPQPDMSPLYMFSIWDGSTFSSSNGIIRNFDTAVADDSTDFGRQVVGLITGNIITGRVAGGPGNEGPGHVTDSVTGPSHSATVNLGGIDVDTTVTVGQKGLTFTGVMVDVSIPLDQGINPFGAVVDIAKGLPRGISEVITSIVDLFRGKKDTFELTAQQEGMLSLQAENEESFNNLDPVTQEVANELADQVFNEEMNIFGFKGVMNAPKDMAASRMVDPAFADEVNAIVDEIEAEEEIASIESAMTHAGFVDSAEEGGTGSVDTGTVDTGEAEGVGAGVGGHLSEAESAAAEGAASASSVSRSEAESAAAEGAIGMGDYGGGDGLGSGNADAAEGAGAGI